MARAEPMQDRVLEVCRNSRPQPPVQRTVKSARIVSTCPEISLST